MTGPPIKVEAGAPNHQDDRPSTTNGIGSHHTANKVQRSVVGRQLTGRRAASYRQPVLDSGRSDPWYYDDDPSAGYDAAIHHLLGHGLLPAVNRVGLRAMHRRGGHSRQVAEFIAERWGLVA